MKIEGVEILNNKDLEDALIKKAERIMLNLKMNNRAIREYRETVKQDVEFLKNGNRPQTIVAGRIYCIGLVTRQVRTQDEVAREVGISVESVRAQFRRIKERR